MGRGFLRMRRIGTDYLKNRTERYPMLFEEQDFADISTFSLAWRWTDAKYWKASEFELKKIRPFTPATARRLWNEMCQKTFGEESNAQAFFATDALECQTDGESTLVVQWLASLFTDQSCQVIIFWEPDKAVVTEQDLFVRHWDDFCFPSVEDVIIQPVDDSWVLFYNHEEMFHFKRT